MANETTEVVELAKSLQDAVSPNPDPGVQVLPPSSEQERFLKVSSGVQNMAVRAVQEAVDKLGGVTVSSDEREAIRKEVLADPEFRAIGEEMCKDAVAAATAAASQARLESSSPEDSRSLESHATESFEGLRNSIGKSRAVTIEDVMDDLHATSSGNNEALRLYRKYGEQVTICDAILRSRATGPSFRPFNDAKSVRDLRCYKDFVKYRDIVWQGAERAMSTGAAGEGAEFIPTILTSNLDDRVRVVPKVFERHATFQMVNQVVTNPFNLSGLTFFIAREATLEDAPTIRASTMGTSDTTWTAQTYGVLTRLSMEMDEDSVISMMPLLRNEIERAQDDMLENGYINGEFETLPSSHFDGVVVSNDDIRLGWDGYRAAAFDNSTGDNRVDLGGSTIEANKIIAVRQGMERYGTDVGRLFMLVSFSGFYQLLGIDQVETVDKFGDGATIRTGSVANIYGMPVFVSQFLSETMETDGTDDGTSATTAFLIVWDGAFIRGERKGLEVAAVWNPETLQRTLTGHERFDVQTPHTPASNAVVGMGFNVGTDPRS